MTVDVMFLAHNRLKFTHASFRALLTNTDWKLVSNVFIVDDSSTDGTHDYLAVLEKLSDFSVTFMPGRYGGPVAAMNHVFDHSEAEVIAKVDNDLILPPGWLNTMLGVLERNTELDALGTEPGFARRYGTFVKAHEYLPARWIGGQGLFRTRAFARRRPRPSERFFGLTHFMRQTMNCGWIDPDLASFNLDHLPFDPWRALAQEYVENGWARAWAPYDVAMSDYWDWWVENRAEVAA